MSTANLKRGLKREGVGLRRWSVGLRRFPGEQRNITRRSESHRNDMRIPGMPRMKDPEDEKMVMAQASSGFCAQTANNWNSPPSSLSSFTSASGIDSNS